MRLLLSVLLWIRIDSLAWNLGMQHEIAYSTFWAVHNNNIGDFGIADQVQDFMSRIQQMEETIKGYIPCLLLVMNFML